MSQLDDERFVSWWERIQPAIESQARRIVPSEFEDVVQETAISLYEVFKGCPNSDDGFARFASYAKRMVRWRAVDYLRRRRPVQSLSTPIQGPSPTGEQLAIGREIVDLVNQLPDVQRKTITKYLMGHPLKDIAEEFRTEEPTVRSNLRHARYRLANMLSDILEDREK